MAVQTIPACHGVAIELDVGSEIVVINTYGTQVLDTWASIGLTLESTYRWSTLVRA